MKITEFRSPNFDSRGEQAVDMLVLHYTGMPAARDALDRLCDEAAKVSAHYVVDEDGTIYRLVAEENRAWHAGVSSWRGHSNINQRSIGIEIVNPGHEFGYRSFPAVQMESVAALCREIITRHGIPARNVVAHSDVAPVRKEDPGELFNWKQLAELDIGLWPRELYAKPSVFQWPLDILGLIFRLSQDGSSWGWGAYGIPTKRNGPLYSMAAGPLPSDEQLKTQLAHYGYDTTDLTKTIAAFQRHFFPQRLTGVWDHECAVRLASLLVML